MSSYWKFWAPEPGLAYCTPLPRAPHYHRIAKHRSPSRWRTAARALLAGAARTLAVPAWIPHVIYTHLEVAWTR